MERERHKVMYKHAQASSYATRSANRCGEEIPLKGMFRAICFCKRKLFFFPPLQKAHRSLSHSHPHQVFLICINFKVVSKGKRLQNSSSLLSVQIRNSFFFRPSLSLFRQQQRLNTHCILRCQRAMSSQRITNPLKVKMS